MPPNDRAPDAESVQDSIDLFRAYEYYADAYAGADAPFPDMAPSCDTALEIVQELAIRGLKEACKRQRLEQEVARLREEAGAVNDALGVIDLCMAPGAVADLRQALQMCVRELSFMLRTFPDRDGGKYREALDAAQEALSHDRQA